MPVNPRIDTKFFYFIVKFNNMHAGQHTLKMYALRVIGSFVFLSCH